MNLNRDFVCMCVVTLHSCPILAMVALPVCSPSMAFSLKNRKILSSSGLSLSGIKCTPTNLGSRGKKRKRIKHRSNTVRSEMCHTFVHTRLNHTHPCTNDILRSNLCPNGNPFTPILHLRNQSPMIFSSHGSVITAIHFTPWCYSIWLYPKWALQVQIPHNPCLWTTSSQTHMALIVPGNTWINLSRL